jgi:hypothetical protein
MIIFGFAAPVIWRLRDVLAAEQQTAATACVADRAHKFLAARADISATWFPRKHARRVSLRKGARSIYSGK